MENSIIQIYRETQDGIRPIGGRGSEVGKKCLLAGTTDWRKKVNQDLERWAEEVGAANGDYICICVSAEHTSVYRIHLEKTSYKAS